MSESSHKNTLSLSTSRQAQAADATSSPLYISSTGSILRNMPVETPISIPVWTPQDEETLRRSTYDDLRSVMNRLEALMLGCQQVLRAKYNEASGAPTSATETTADIKDVMLSRVMRRLAGESFDFSSAQEVYAEAQMIATANEVAERERIVTAAVEDLQRATAGGTLVTNMEALKGFLANRETVMTDAWCTRYVTAIRRLVVCYQSYPASVQKHIGSTLSHLVQYETCYIALLRASQGRLTELIDVTTQTPPLSMFVTPNGSPHKKLSQAVVAQEKKKELPQPRAQPTPTSKSSVVADLDRTPSVLEVQPVERTSSGSPVKRQDTPPPPIQKQRPPNRRSSSPCAPSDTNAPFKKTSSQVPQRRESIQPRDASQSPRPYPAPTTTGHRPPAPAPTPAPAAAPAANRLTSNTFVVKSRPRRTSFPATQEMPPCTVERTRVAPARGTSADKTAKSSTNETGTSEESMYQRLEAEKAQNTNKTGRPVAPEYKRRPSLGIDSYFLPKSRAAASPQRSASPESARRSNVDLSPAPTSHLLVQRHREQQAQLANRMAARAQGEKECPAQRVERAPMSREQQLALYDDVPPFFIPPAQNKASPRGERGAGCRRGEVRSASPSGAGGHGSRTSAKEMEPPASAPRSVRTAPIPDTVIRRNRSRSPGVVLR